MPAPGSFITVSSYPFSVTVTQAEFNGGTFGGTANAVWFRIDADTARLVVGFYIERGGTFSPRWRLYGEDGDDDPALFTVSSSFNPSWYYALSDTEATTYYLKVDNRPTGSTPSDFDFTFHADDRPVPVEVNIGDIIVHDDVGTNIPAAVVDPATGEVRGYVDLPASEHAAQVVDGTSVFYDRFGKYAAAGTFAVFDPDLQYVVSTSQVFADPPSITASADEVFVLGDSTDEIYRINLTTGGTTLVATIDAPAPVPTAIGVNADGTVLYFVDSSSYFGGGDPVIYAWDLVNDVALPDLYTEPDLIPGEDGGVAVTANLWPGEILVLPDSSIVTFVQLDEVAEASKLIHIAADGTLLHEYTYEWVADDRQINHIAYADDGSERVVVWFYTVSDFFETATITTVTLADGSESNTITLDQFSGGRSARTDSDNPFGISNSCTFLIMGARGAGSPGSPTPGSPEEIPEGKIGPIAWVEEWEDAA